MLSKIKNPSNIDDLLEILKNKHDVKDDEIQCTGINFSNHSNNAQIFILSYSVDFGLEEERKAASIFHHPVGAFKIYNNFGTRAHYIFTVDINNGANFVEFSYNKDNDSWDKAEYSFNIES